VFQTRPRTRYSHARCDPRRLLPAIADFGAGVHLDHSNERQSHGAAERALDEVLAESFPASDPPSWNPGVARPVR
jgi:hypothetical protein